MTTNNTPLRVLVACEFSGTVRDAFLAAGHDAWSCDVLPADGGGPHFQEDVLGILDRGWDLMVAHPPCTYLTNSGVTWLYNKDGSHNDPRWSDLDQGAAFFKALLDAPIPRIAVENPIMHKYAIERIGNRKQSQVVQPWMFGHTEQKATCLWLKGLPLLVPTNNVKAAMMVLPANQRQRLHYLPPSTNRWKLRSTTYPGIAKAMAEQWGGIIADDYPVAA